MPHMTVVPERLACQPATSGPGHCHAPGSRGPMMEADALATHIWSGQGAREKADAVPDPFDEQQPEGSGRAFRDLGVAEPICGALEAAGITTAFPIQALALPIALDGHDLIGQARTGTGKTLAFGIAILQRLGDTPPDGG